MSARNLFVLRFNDTANSKTLYDVLDAYMKFTNFSIVFEPMGYWDEILNCLNCKRNYFTVTENKCVIECEDIFSTRDSFEYARRFPRRYFRDKEHEFLQNKLSFLNDIVQILFEDSCVKSVEVYMSDQYSTDLDAFDRCIQVVDRNLTEALIGTYQSTKKDKYFGMKTVKFIVER